MNKRSAAMKTLLLDVSVVVVGTALIWLGQVFGLWWLALVIGLMLGFVIVPGRFALGLALLCGGLGWGLPLLYRASYLAIGRDAGVVASIIGVGSGNGWIIITLTVGLGTVLCVCATWTGIALRQVLGVSWKIV